ncbi:lytic transglycosylase domain-containing protein [Blastococcus haudaquaticus]|uniref:Membrane-bound lytic murein transglycosylase B n=1 Tax=Blastococcus haudaquaticus TaxID=1938745 RepID=A0A286H4R7_9ACTN|nr:lytic murein transglycosylase [Blastococcus haudaquaticus]SOE02319.1 Membrane-bound lytic murein transglycosylase B [Blastococcus haudaquaticus]
MAAGVVAAFTAMVAPPAQSQGLSAAGQVTDLPRSLTSQWSIPALSEGAPRGATTLTAVPAQSAGPQPAPEVVVTGLAANGIPNVALNAYRVAAARMASAKGECGLDWSLLAGIGRIESNHGRYGGAVLGPDGSATPKILGPALDGGQFAYIGDSDDGRWDNDTTYDRAMGPMQFIPTTWRSYAIDADDNGVTDPFNINDAALAAANYLCVAGGNLRTDAGQRKAVLAYNHSDEYVAEVLALARAYATGMPVADLPLVGNTTGGVPAPSGFYSAPAAPGPAIGYRDTTSSPPEQTTAYTGPSAGGGAPTAQPASADGAPPAAGGGGAGAAPQQGSSAPPASGQAPPATSGGQPAPAPAAPAPAAQPPLPVPSVPLPVPAPAPAPVVTPPPPPAPVANLVEGVTCNVPGNLIPDLPNLPVC